MAAPAPPLSPESVQLIQGVSYRQFDLVKDALDHGANVNAVTRDSRNTALHIITQIGNPSDNAKLVPIIKLLLSRGANLNIQNRDGTTALMFATTSKNIETMRLLLDAGADASLRHNSGQTALNMARDVQFAEGVTLLEHRAAAPPAAAVSSVANPEENKKLADAVRMVDKDAVVAALAAGADVNSSVGFFQVTPLHWAMHSSTNDQSKMVEIIKLLLEKGADVNLKTSDGVTAFMQSLHSPMFFYLLLKKHPDLAIKTNAGKTVMDIAKGPPRRERVIEVLTKAEAGDWEGAIRFAAEDALASAPPPAPEPTAPLAAVAQAVESAVASVVAPPEQNRALEAAVTANDDAAAQAAILAGANPNMMLHGDRETVFIHYAITENRPMVEFLLAHGADINGRAGPGADEPGGTALNYTRTMDIGEFIEERGGLTARMLDYGPVAPPSLEPRTGDQRLRGREDMDIQPITLVEDYVSGGDEGNRMEVIDVKDVFVANADRTLTLDQFFRKFMGDGIVFNLGPNFYGIARKELIQEYMEGTAIVYECTKTFAMDDPGTRGTFEYSDIYAAPYFALRTAAGVLYLPLSTMKGVLAVSHGFYRIENKPMKKLENIASRSSVLAGGPVSSQLHCQAGSDGSVYKLIPFRLPDIEDDEEKEKEEKEEEEPNIVYVKKGEDKTEFPLDLSQTVLQLKEAVKEKLGIAVETQKMVFQGKVLKDDQTLGEAKVGKGYVIQLQVSGGRKTFRNKKKKEHRKTRKNSR
uniref:Ubiquitin-like domain-containing protein n=1 Tax=viral metagenome TaxID=1070528 RepID=A0A6C0AK17_9ZZZZ